MGFEPTVEQDPDRIKWELNKWQNRVKTKKRQGLGKRQNRIANKRWGLNNWTKKDANLRNGRIEL